MKNSTAARFPVVRSQGDAQQRHEPAARCEGDAGLPVDQHHQPGAGPTGESSGLLGHGMGTPHLVEGHVGGNQRGIDGADHVKGQQSHQGIDRVFSNISFPGGYLLLSVLSLALSATQ
ncbi:MAG: hypothetical protein K2X97_17800 [Mycobacteriaceae bacterium]|nr:hypothetical protein [Mycobacteriaceae bacterium]